MGSFPVTTGVGAKELLGAHEGATDGLELGLELGWDEVSLAIGNAYHEHLLDVLSYGVSAAHDLSAMQGAILPTGK